MQRILYLPRIRLWRWMCLWFVKKSSTIWTLTFNFKKADFSIILCLLVYISWSNLDHFVTVNDALSHFYDIIFAVIADCVPRVKYKPCKFPHWYNPDLIALIKEKEKARKRFTNCCRDKSSDAYKEFSALCNNVKNLQQKCHSEYVQQVGSDIKENPKRFWSYVNSQTTSSSLRKWWRIIILNFLPSMTLLKLFASILSLFL